MIHWVKIVILRAKFWPVYSSKKSKLKRFFYTQITIILVTGFLFGILNNALAGISALIGGLLCFVANAVFASIFFRYRGAQAAKKIATSFFYAEMVKIFLVAVMFFIVIKYFTVNFLALLIGFIAAQLTSWVVLLTKQEST